MADGIMCKHCGWSETAHIFEDDDELKEGYELTLSQCKNETNRDFSPEDPELATRLAQKVSEEKLMQAMRGLPPT